MNTHGNKTRRYIARALALFCAVLMLFALAGCAKKPASESEEQTHRDDNHYLPGKRPIDRVHTRRVSSDSIFANCGNFIFVAGNDSDYTIEFEDAGYDIEWKLFIFDTMYKGDLATLEQDNEPALVGPGTVTVKNGQYIYLHSSINELNAEEPPQGVFAIFTGAGLPF